MHRPGADPEAMLPSDILCDFCGRPWGEEVLMVEGHQGSCICGDCLAAAWQSVINADIDDALPPSPEGSEPSWKCALCLEARDDTAFRSPIREEAFVCQRCIRMAGRILGKDADSDWSRPLPGTATEPNPDDPSHPEEAP